MGGFILGIGGIALVVGGAGLGGVALRRWAVPGWTGAAGWLAATVGSLVIVVVAAEVVGGLGLFDAVPLVLAVSLTGLGCWRFLPARADQAPPAAVPPWEHRMLAPALVLSTAVVAGQWTARLLGGVRSGMAGYDNSWYHLPVAAQLARSGSLGHAPVISPDFPVSWHQSTVEALHGIGMVLFGTDVASVWLFVPFAALSLLAAWCLGAPSGFGALSVLGVLALLGTTLVGLGNVAGAYSDLPALAFLLAGVAVWAQPQRGSGSLFLAGAAAGLALSSKLTVLGVVGAFAVLVVVTSPRGRRLLAAASFGGALALTGAFWFIRNLVHTGNPIPSTALGIGDASLPPGEYETVERYGYSVADYLTSPGVWRSHFFPGLKIDLGPGWPLLLVLVALVPILALARRRSSLELVSTGIGVLVLVGLASYVTAPTTALGPRGQPILFASNVRYLIPVLGLALAALPVVASERNRRWLPAFVAAFPAALVAAQLGDVGGRYPAWPAAHRVGGVVVAIAVGVVGSFLLRGRARAAWPSMARGALVAGGAAMLVGLIVTARSADSRYRDDPIDAWGRAQRDQRIAVAEVELTYPLYGENLSNEVEWVGRAGDHGELLRLTSCATWRDRLRRGGYDAVVVGLLDEPEAARWTASDPAATPLIETLGRVLYRFDPDQPDPGCPTG